MNRPPEDPDDGWAPQDAPSVFQVTDLTGALAKPIPRPKTLSNLIYPGKLHTISGEPESGKTVVGLWFLLQAIGYKRHVVLVDEEVGAAQTADVLQSYGADPAAVGKYLHYYDHVNANWMGQRAQADLDKMLAEHAPVIIMFDSATSMLASSGVNGQADTEVRRFYDTVYRPITRNHSCGVIVIDHDAKNGADSRYARGSGDKLAVVDMTLKLVVQQPFSRDTDGLLTATVTKDRLGCLHRNWQVTVTRQPLALTWAKTSAQAPARRGGGMAPGKQALKDVLTDMPATVKELVDRMVAAGGRPLKPDTANGYLNELADEGQANKIDQGQGQPALWTKPTMSWS